MKFFIPIALFIALAVIAYFYMSPSTQADSYEMAPYEVLRTDGPYEIRRYDEMVFVSTEMKSMDRRNGPFMALAGFINGKNEAEQKIAMTTPVFMEGDEEDEGATMSFMMPREVAEAGTPAPKNGEKVEVKERALGKVVVYRYSGKPNAENRVEAVDKLRAWILENEVTLADPDEIIFAVYDGPGTPAEKRRNEVMFRVAD